MGWMRREGWERALSAEVEAARTRPFEWGRHDCALWAADCVMAMTGNDPAACWRGRYRTALGAARILRRSGCDDIAAMAARVLDAPLPSPVMARRGDILSDGEAMGVCIGAAAAFLSPDGLVFKPLAACAVGWRV